MSSPRLLLAVLAGVVGAGLAACGSSGPSPAASSPARPTASTSAGSSSAAPSAGGSAAKTIAANWAAFFNAKTPAARRISLLQDGQQFASVIKSQAGTGLAAAATAKVTKVTVTSATQAKVSYSILIAGQAALSNQSGVAVQQDGTWKVGLASFCGLLSLENTGSSSKLPGACKSAG
jgi:hypothetical protein